MFYASAYAALQGGLMLWYPCPPSICCGVVTIRLEEKLIALSLRISEAMLGRKKELLNV